MIISDHPVICLSSVNLKRILTKSRAGAIDSFMEQVITIPALGDNFIYLYMYDEGKVLCVDPAQAQGILAELAANNLVLTHILLTHHHYDHTGGVDKLKSKAGCEVIAPGRGGFGAVDTVAVDGQKFTFGAYELCVIATPGHTASSVCYYIRSRGSDEKGVVFTGDTLFIAGCGRILEGDAETMFGSLMKLAALPDDTLVYPGHDYTVENLQFALMVGGDNADAHRLLLSLTSGRTDVQNLPSTIGQEKLVNPFLRADSAAIRKRLDMTDASTVKVFAELRRRKDVF